MNIGIIGRAADGMQLYDGQTVKTRVVRDELKLRYPDSRIMLVETVDFLKHGFRIVRNTFKVLKNCDVIFVLLSAKGKTVFFPLLYYLNKHYRKHIYHDAIGGRLAIQAGERKRWVKYLNSFEVNWVELPSLRDDLKALGVNNAEYLPNFKRINVIDEKKLDLSEPEVFRFCTFSRVCETKGILVAAQAVAECNKRLGRKAAELHIYGPIENGFEDQLHEELERNKDCVFYEGITPYDKSVETIRNYYALLFPTTFPGEGFPGTVIDAFSSGVPVIASDWRYNSEIIADGETGYIYPYQQPEKFTELVCRAVSDPKMILSLKKNCVREAHKYSPDTVMAVIEERIKNDLAK